MKSKPQIILEAWATLMRPSKTQKILAKERYEVCFKCKHRKPSLLEYCGECLCPLQAKVFTLSKPGEEGNCPKNFWKN